MALAAQTLLLVRHAESEHNARVGAEHASDSPLSERGRAQADALCERLERELDGVPSAQIGLVSSDLQRCLQTLAPFAARRGLRVELEPALREPAQRAVATQVVDPEAARALLDAITRGASPQAPPPAETHAMLVARLRAVLANVRDSRATTLVLCSHYVTLNVLVRLLLDPDAPRAGLWARFDNGSVTRVERSQGAAPTLVYLNRA